MKASLFVFDRDPLLLNYIGRILSSQKLSVTSCTSVTEALKYFRTGYSPEVALLGCDPDHCANLIGHLLRHSPDTAVAAMPCIGVHCDVAPIQAGAHLVLRKPFVAEQLTGAISQLMIRGQAQAGEEPVELPIDKHTSFVYASTAMRQIQEQAALVARVSLPVLILGESGTGKEVIARYIHSLSPQADHTFLKVNCAAMPAELLESELFGYEQGAFTGAARRKPGKFKLCDNGTMFLDEVGEMHPNLQAKLLQVLQDGTFTPLGSQTTVRVRVRIIAATNIDIKTAMANRTFREDLYYRLNGFSFIVPPLRERRQDITVLARYFVRRHSQEYAFPNGQPRLPSRLLRMCLSYDWPGNSRELEAFMKRYLVLNDEQLMIDELSRAIADQDRDAEAGTDRLLQALHEAGGNRRLAAKTLKISYKVLLQRLRDCGLHRASQDKVAMQTS